VDRIIIFKHPVAFIYASYTLKYTVFNATLNFSAAETCGRPKKKEKLKVALKTVYFSVYEVDRINPQAN
jgi:hypothetical protein